MASGKKLLKDHKTEKLRATYSDVYTKVCQFIYDSLFKNIIFNLCIISCSRLVLNDGDFFFFDSTQND